MENLKCLILKAKNKLQICNLSKNTSSITFQFHQMTSTCWSHPRKRTFTVFTWMIQPIQFCFTQPRLGLKPWVSNLVPTVSMQSLEVQPRTLVSSSIIHPTSRSILSPVTQIMLSGEVLHRIKRCSSQQVRRTASYGMSKIGPKFSMRRKKLISFSVLESSLLASDMMIG